MAKSVLAGMLALAAALAALALLPAEAQAPRGTGTVQRIAVAASAIERFDPRDPARTRFGALDFRGGLVLQSQHRDFGGFSALRVQADGEHFLAATDKGYWLRGRIAYRAGKPVAIRDAEMAPILGTDGRPLAARGWYDTEALAQDGNTLYIGIERVHRIVRADIGKDGLRARAAPIAVPPGMKALPSNKGIECLEMPPRGAALAGTLIAISERGLDPRGNIRGFLVGKSSGTFSVRRTDEFDISDCALAPHGNLLILERRFSWLRGLAIRIRSLPLAEIGPGALLDGPELFFADMGAEIDNMEGLSVHRESSGALVLTLISDDNFSALQRTLLLQFTLAE